MRTATRTATRRAASCLRPSIVAIAFGLAGLMAALFFSYAASPRSAQAAPVEPCSTAVPGQSIQRLISSDPSVSVQPNLGPSGSQATLHVWNFLPNQSVSAIFRVTGDPVVATGTIDASGQAYLPFTVPQAPNGTYWILVAQENRTCVHAAVHFTIGPTPPVTPTVPPPPTPTLPPPPTPAISPTAPPQPPVAGTGSTTGDLGIDAGLAAIAFFAMAAGFGTLAVARRTRRRRED